MCLYQKEALGVIMSIVNKENARHYKWGNNSDGWHLLDSQSLSVIEECIPAGGGEERHYHSQAQQFFYILSGVAEITISEKVFTVAAGNGLHVPAKSIHALRNNTKRDLRILVISEPKSHGDKVVV